VADQRGTSFVDCLSPFYDSGRLTPDTLWADGVHLTEAGHQILGQTIANTLLQTAN
jgi:lysophospholipase L1-like esterase